MSQATATAVAAKVESLGEADLLPFHELLDAEHGQRGAQGREGPLQSIASTPRS